MANFCFLIIPAAFIFPTFSSTTNVWFLCCAYSCNWHYFIHPSWAKGSLVIVYLPLSFLPFLLSGFPFPQYVGSGSLLWLVPFNSRKIQWHDLSWWQICFFTERGPHRKFSVWLKVKFGGSCQISCNWLSLQPLDHPCLLPYIFSDKSLLYTHSPCKIKEPTVPCFFCFLKWYDSTLSMQQTAPSFSFFYFFYILGFHAWCRWVRTM